ncbi:MAG TPA: coenzyme F420-0:L-glutamate ligase [Candidatus Acidoferrum sp.]|jgi:coenzyme F420-0:L-glutamate ligase/coenzyme F420-1:gamma-L-glutamate ligase
MPNPRPIQLLPIHNIPEIRPGDNLSRIFLTAAKKSKITFQQNDILVLAQKIISKSENRLIDLTTITPSQRAIDLAAKSDKDRPKDPRLVELILRESRRIVREHPVLIVETHHGFVCANAGVDQSNIPGETIVSLLPENPDTSAKKIAQAIKKITRKKIAVIISDTFGRPWRLGLTNVAIGCYGISPMEDLRGTRDMHKKPLHATIIALADELAAAAGLLMQKSSATPAILIRNYPFKPSSASAATIIRPPDLDLFR